MGYNTRPLMYKILTLAAKSEPFQGLELVKQSRTGVWLILEQSVLQELTMTTRIIRWKITTMVVQSRVSVLVQKKRCGMAAKDAHMMHMLTFTITTVNLTTQTNGYLRLLREGQLPVSQMVEQTSPSVVSQEEKRPLRRELLT